MATCAFRCTNSGASPSALFWAKSLLRLFTCTDMERLVPRNEITLVVAESGVTEFFRLLIQLCVDVGNSEQSCCCKVWKAPMTEGAPCWRMCSPFAAAEGLRAVADCLWRSVVPAVAPSMQLLYDGLCVSAASLQHSVTYYDAATVSGVQRPLYWRTIQGLMACWTDAITKFSRGYWKENPCKQPL